MAYSDLSISVIIPVYNAAEFIAKAVESALNQPEVAEVLLIEDGSKDNSFGICTLLSEKNEKVKLLTHPNNENRGAGESRNLGIKNAKCDFLAFLDADDYYLPGRFKTEGTMFEDNPGIDGIYGAMGFYYYSEEGKKRYKEMGYQDVATISGKIPANELFYSLVHIHNSVSGQFHLNTLTVKRSVFAGKTELFNNFTMHEDTAFLIQLSLNCRIEPGNIENPVAMYGVHENNRIAKNSINSGSHIRYWKYLYDWSLHSSNGRRFSKLFHAFWIREKLLMSDKFKGALQLVWYSMTNNLFLKKGILFVPAARHVLAKRVAAYILNYKERLQMNIFKSHPYSSIMDEFIKAPKEIGS